MTSIDRPKRVKLSDVASAAGVSSSTASRALAGDARITESTHAAVLQAARSLNYVPNAAARSLRARRTRTLGMLLADLSDPVHGQIAEAFQREAMTLGYTVLILAGYYRHEVESRALKVFVEHDVDGIALVSGTLGLSEAHGRWPSERIVVVQPDQRAASESAGSRGAGVIETDDAAGIRAAVEHLVSAGRRSIAYLAVEGRPSNNLRQAAAEDELARIAPSTPLRVIPVSSDAWREPALLADAVSSPLPDATLCYNDILALALLAGLRRRGIRVPEDIAVVGFDGIPFTAVANPSLSTVATPMPMLGVLAARVLVEAIRSGMMGPERILPVEFIARESTGGGADGR